MKTTTTITITADDEAETVDISCLFDPPTQKGKTLTADQVVAMQALEAIKTMKGAHCERAEFVDGNGTVHAIDPDTKLTRRVP